jgi:hypothetical protein
MYLYIDWFVIVVVVGIIFKYQCLMTNISYMVLVEGHNLLHWSLFMDIKKSIYLNVRHLSRTFNYLSCHWIHDGLSCTTIFKGLEWKKKKKIAKIEFLQLYYCMGL